MRFCRAQRPRKARSWIPFGTPLAHIGHLLGSHWAPFASLWPPLWCPWAPLRCPRATLGSPWAPLGRPWAPFGYPWAPLGCPWAPLGCLWASSGRPWVSLGIPGGPPQKNVAQVPRLRTRSSLGEFAPLVRLVRLVRRSGVMKCCSDPPSTRAGGQDYVSFTNSLKLYPMNYLVYGLHVWYTI